MNSETQTLPLSDLVRSDSPITYGVVKPGDEDPLGVPFVRSGDVSSGSIDVSSLRTITKDVSRQYKRTLLEGGEILVSLVGDPGQAAIVPDCLKGANIARQVALIRINPSFSRDYIYYYLTSQQGKNSLIAFSKGSVQQVINLSDLQQVEIPLPPLRQQQSIAHILGTLDDKIELNRRMSQTLEEMARALFKSWFVDFDPVHAKAALKDHSPLPKKPPTPRQHPPAEQRAATTLGSAPPLPSAANPSGGSAWTVERAQAYLERMDPAIAALFPDSFEKSELGEVPFGWGVGKISELINVDPSRKLAKGSIAPYLEMKCVPTSGHTATGVYSREFTSGTKFQCGDTLLARITPCLENGKTTFVDFLKEEEIGWGSTEFIVMCGKSFLHNPFVYCLARSEVFRSYAIRNMVGSSGRQRVTSKVLADFQMSLPPCCLVDYFSILYGSFLKKISKASAENSTLASIRDTLLPKLLSGELQVVVPEELSGGVIP